MGAPWRASSRLAGRWGPAQSAEKSVSAEAWSPLSAASMSSGIVGATGPSPNQGQYTRSRRGKSHPGRSLGGVGFPVAPAPTACPAPGTWPVHAESERLAQREDDLARRFPGLAIELVPVLQAYRAHGRIDSHADPSRIAHPSAEDLGRARIRVPDVHEGHPGDAPEDLVTDLVVEDHAGLAAERRQGLVLQGPGVDGHGLVRR